MLILLIVFEIWKSNRRGGKKERKKERITGNKKNIKVKNKKSHHYMMTFNHHYMMTFNNNNNNKFSVLRAIYDTNAIGNQRKQVSTCAILKIHTNLHTVQ